MVLCLRPTGVLVQVVRSSMMTALSSAYVKTARARGVRGRTIIFVHALRNALLPVITVASDQAAGILNGAVIVETVFGFPGIGKLMIDSVLLRDYAVIQAAVLVTALAVFIPQHHRGHHLCPRRSSHPVRLRWPRPTPWRPAPAPRSA